LQIANVTALCRERFVLLGDLKEICWKWVALVSLFQESDRATPITLQNPSSGAVRQILRPCAVSARGRVCQNAESEHGEQEG
jgi:hypothetical protein